MTDRKRGEDMCRSAAQGGRRCPGGGRGGDGSDVPPAHEVTIGRVINNPAGPLHTGSGDQYNSGSQGEATHVGTGRQHTSTGDINITVSPDGQRHVTVNETSDRSDRARARAERTRERGERARARAERGERSEQPTTFIHGSTGPISSGGGTQVNVRNPDGTYTTFSAGRNINVRRPDGAWEKLPPGTWE